MNLASVSNSSESLVGKSLKTYWPNGKVRGTFFTILNISERGITITPESTGKPRIIRAFDVNLMGERWDDCKSGRVRRSDLANGTPAIFNTSYLSSIFHSIDNES